MVTAKERQIAGWERQIVEREAKIRKRKKKGLKVGYIERAIKTLKTKIRLAKATSAAEKLRIARETPGVSYTVVGLGGKVLETRGAPKPKAVPKRVTKPMIAVAMPKRPVKPAPKGQETTTERDIRLGIKTEADKAAELDKLARMAAETRAKRAAKAAAKPKPKLAAVTRAVDIEEQRRRNLQAYNASAAGRAAASRKAEEIKKQQRKVQAREASLDRAIEIYQQTATPLSERVREIQIERPDRGVEAGRETRKEGARREGATFAEAEEEYGAAEPVKVPTITETVEQATEELIEEGYREEDIRTPFVELGGVKETGFLAPYVLAKIEEEADIPVEERAVITEPFREEPIIVAPLVPDAVIDPKIDTGIRRLLMLMFGATLIKYLVKGEPDVIQGKG